MKEIYNILIKHFSGSITADEESIVQDYKKSNSLEYDSLKKLWLSEGKIDIVNFNPQKAWEKTEKKLSQTTQDVFFARNQLPRFAIFAALVIAVLITTWFISNDLINPKQMQSHINISEQVTKVQLSDGSRIWLNSDAKLSYPENFRQKERNVELIGEAYFEVVGNENWPFNISTPNSNITVLGTSFNVKTNTELTEVVVNSGNVSVFSGDGKHHDIVKIGEVANVNKNSLQIESNTNINFLAWKTGNFQFDGNTIHEIVVDLNSYYKNQIAVDSSSTFDCALTGYFSQADLSEIIETLVLTCGVKAKMDGSKYIISNR